MTNIEEKKTSTNETHEKKLRLAERRLLVFKYRRNGWSYRQIANSLAGKFGVSSRYGASNAYNDVKVVLNEIKSKYREEAEEVRDIELQRLDTLFEKYYDLATSGDIMALNACLSIMDRRAKYYDMDSMKKEDFSTLLNFDVKDLTTEQLKRIANGENPILVITNTDNTDRSGTGTSETK